MSTELGDLHEFNERVGNGDSGEKVTVYSRRAPSRANDTAPTSAEHAAETKDTSMWAVHGGRNFSPCEKAMPSMPSGQYTINMSDSIGIYFSRTDINLDELVKLPDSVSQEVIEEIAKFWTKEQHFRSFGFLWKRGVLMWGPPGSGKTSTLQVISEEIIKRDGLSIYVDNPSLAAKGLKLLRQIEPKRSIIVMLEDIDSIIDMYGESDLLALMDGELQIDNVVFVATTNYPERLDKRFINRPSRFDIVKKIGMPNKEARRLYLTTKCVRLNAPETRDELDKWVRLSEGFSIAHLKELIVSVEVFEVSLENAVARLKTMMNVSPVSGDEGNKPGFL